MKEQFEAVLTGTDGAVDGVIAAVKLDNGTPAYEFKSLDQTLRLVIAQDEKGNWQRIDGTEPYLSGWIDQLAELVSVSK